jgi:maltose alpha-D-glucosyltransferase/alpha-amylase
MSGPQWLREAVFYQIYPQSFYDANGDGIGDLPGVIAKLDYVKETGFDGIWLNPCFRSPFRDGGYDVTDFYSVDPRYGTNADLRRLFEEAEHRGIRVVLDLVAGHTSLENPWFKASARHDHNAYSNWFIWSDHWTEFHPELRMTGGLGERNGNFVNNFFYCQPALNYGFAEPDPDRPWELPVDHPDVLAVREELKNIMRFWLDMGASGFRVDMASSLVKCDPEKRETIRLWQDVREMFDREFPDAALIAEWSDPTKALEAGFHVDFLIHFYSSAYTSLFRHEQGRNVTNTWIGDSYFDRRGRGDIAVFLEEYRKHYQNTSVSGYISLPSGNHDLPRISLGRDREELKAVLVFLLTMPGVPFIYYGDEIGMRQLDLPDKEGAYTRTGARTPMQWGPGPCAGFSTAAPEELYLPIDPDPERPTVESQRCDSSSPYVLTKRLIALRRRSPALAADSAFEPLTDSGYPFVYLRSCETQAMLVVVNPAGSAAEVQVPTGRSVPNTDTRIAPVTSGGGRCSVTSKSTSLHIAVDPVGWAIYEMER